MKIPRVGIVGAAGQVGLALLKALNTDHGLTAVGICRNKVSAARVASQGMSVRVVQTDNGRLLDEATHDLDVLVNCALPRYQPSKTSATNRRLASSLGIACSGKLLVHLSSVAVYGDFLSGRKSLFHNPKPDTGYGQQKGEMERLLREVATKCSMKCTILRVGHVYGPELSWSQAFFDLIKDDGFRLPFDGQMPSNAIAIGNVIAGIREVLFSKPGQPTLNLLDTPQTTWREVFDLHSQASGSPPVEPLNQHDSEWHFRAQKEWAETGMAERLARESWRWVKHLPASYIASVPTFKAIAQWAVGQVGSPSLDSRLWAIYCKRFAPGIKINSTLEILPIFLSEPVPGPCLSYQASTPAESLATLRDWHDAISAPQANLWRSFSDRRKVGQEIS